MPSVTTAILIPAFNCERTIAAVVAGARQIVPTVLVVNDGSTDATAVLATGAGAEVVPHAANCGKGAALLTGMRHLAARGVDRVVTLDGDGQHLAEEVPRVLAVSDAEPDALVIGERQFDAVAIAPIKLFGNRFANRWVEIACGQRLADTQSGLRCYPLSRTLALNASARHFAFETEVLIRAARAGIPIRSVPVRVYYPPIAERTSHFRPVVDTIRIIFVVLGLIFRLR